MPRAKKTVTIAVDTPQAAESALQAEEKKQRKANGWNVYYKENHGKFKVMEEHKGKSHQDVTRAIAASYKASKSTGAEAAPVQSEQ